MADSEAGPTNAPQDPKDPSDPKDPPATRTYSQEEMDRITAKVRKNARRDAELTYRREQAAAAPAPKADDTPAPKEDVEPKRDDFETHEDYQRELTRFEARKTTREERKAERQEEEKQRAKESNDKAAEAWKGKIEKAVTKHADFEEVLEDNEDVLEVIHGAPMRAFITESDVGPEIVYHLCQHPAEAKRIAALPRYKQAAEIAKIEEQLTAAAKPAPKEGDDAEEVTNDDAPDPEDAARERNADGTYKAPKKETPKKLDEPIEPVGARPARASAEPLDSDDPETWRRKEVARIRKLQGK